MRCNIIYFITLFFYSAFLNGAVYCSDNYDMYKLWPKPLEPFTKLVTEVCCERSNSQISTSNKSSRVLTLQIQMKLGSAIKIRNLDLGASGQTEIVCDKELKGKECLVFYSINDNKRIEAREFEGNPGLILRQYNYDIAPRDVRVSNGDLPFFMFNKIRGEVTVVGANKSNLTCQAKRKEKTDTANSNDRSERSKGSSGGGSSGNRKKPILEDQHVSVLEDNPS